MKTTSIRRITIWASILTGLALCGWLAFLGGLRRRDLSLARRGVVGVA